MSVSPDRWIKVRALFFAALDADPSARTSLLRNLADGDESLQREVQRLLDLDAGAGAFLDRPACDLLSFLAVLSSSPPAAAAQLSPGEFIAGRFEIISLIGIGGMGEVYEARDQVLGGTIALKIVRQGIEPIETMAARLLREATLARRVAHSSVCRVHDVIRHVLPDGRDFLVLTMELVRGDTLRTKLQSRDLSSAQALDIARQVAAGLDAAHTNGVLHRDVKPENIILEPRANGSLRAVLTDFGLAQATTAGNVMSRVTQTGMLVGTLAYIAPEVLRGEEPSKLSDLYAFAVVVREMLSAGKVAPSTPQRQALQRALGHDPQERFSTAREFVEALAPEEPAPLPATIAGGNRRVIVVAIGLLFALILPFVRLPAPGPRRLQIPHSSMLLLTDIVNKTNEPSLDGATEVLRSQTGAVTPFHVSDTREHRDRFQDDGPPARHAAHP